MQTADRVRQILSSRGLTLYQVSRRSAEIFGQASPYFIRQGLYRELTVGTQSPNIHQLAALSQISNYRLCDWLAVFGFHLDEIPKLQLLNQWPKTVVLDSSVYDELQWIPWFGQSVPQLLFTDIRPLGQMVKVGAPRRARELLALNKTRFLYARVGREDLFAFPHLAPGSIARIDVRSVRDELSVLGPGISKRMFLVETGASLNCSHLRRIEKGRLLLSSPDYPFNQLELTLGSGVRILGVVTAEIRPMSPQSACKKPPLYAFLPKAPSLARSQPRGGLQQLLRQSRLRAGVSFREASAMSQRLARIFGDRMYFAAAGTLSDYENSSSPLRHIQKIISLCALYCIDFWNFIRVGGLQLDLLGNEPMSDQMVGRTGIARLPPCDESAGPAQRSEAQENFLSTLIRQWEELPLFVRSALPAIFKLKNFSLSDMFWVGGNRNPVHPCLVGATLVAVNRRIKTPPRPTAPTAWEQPLFIILKRDGSYLCASCALRRDILIVHPHSDLPNISMKFRNGIDAEIVGQVTSIVRSLA